MSSGFCKTHSRVFYARCAACALEASLPSIDASMTPRTTSDRNLPFDSLGVLRAKQAAASSPAPHKPPMTLDECCAAEGAGYGALPLLPDGYFDNAPPAANAPRAHSHYFKDVAKLKTIDVYRALALFNVTDPCLQHAVKKLLVAGGRGGGKDIRRDIQEAIDTLVRWQEMRTEEAAS